MRKVFPSLNAQIRRDCPLELHTLSFRATSTDPCETYNSLVREQNPTFTAKDFSYILPPLMLVAQWRDIGPGSAGYFRLNKRTGNVLDRFVCCSSEFL